MQWKAAMAKSQQQNDKRVTNSQARHMYCYTTKQQHGVSQLPGCLSLSLLPNIWKCLKVLCGPYSYGHGSKLGCQEERTMCDITDVSISAAVESKMLLSTAGFIGMPGGTPPLVVASGRSKSLVPSCTISTDFDIKTFWNDPKHPVVHLYTIGTNHTR